MGGIETHIVLLEADRTCYTYYLKLLVSLGSWMEMGCMSGLHND